MAYSSIKESEEAVAARNYGSAILCVIALLCTACRNAESYVARGMELASRGKTEDALLNFRKAIQKDTSYGPAYLAFGKVAVTVPEHLPEGYRMLKQATRLMPDSEEARIELAKVSLGAYAFSQRRLPVMYEDLRSATEFLTARNPRSFEALQFKGSLAMLDRKPAEAVNAFEEANKVRPWQPGIITELVQAYLAVGRVTDAEHLGTEMLAREKAYAPLYDILHAHYLRSKQPEKAENLLKQKVENLPNEVRPVLELASFYQGSGNRENMKRVLDSLLTDQKRYPDAQVQVAAFYIDSKDPETALKILQTESADLTPEQKLRKARATANAYLTLGRLPDAREVVENILKQFPNDASAQAIRASILQRGGRLSDIAEVTTQLRSLAERNPRNADIHIQLARALAALQNYDSAASAYMQSLKVSDSASVRLELSATRLQQGQTAMALQLAKEVLDRQPQNAEAQMTYAAALTASGQFDQARMQLGKLPRSPEVDLQLATVAIAQRRYKDAEGLIKPVIAAQPSNSKALQSLAECFWSQGDVSRSIQTLSEFLDKHPEARPVRVQLANNAVGAGRVELAISQYQALVSQDPNWPAWHFHLGRVLGVKGDVAGAEQHLRRATELGPGQAIFWLGLADLYRSGARTKEAVIALRRAVELEPTNALAKNNLAYMVMESGGNLDEAVKFAQDAVQLDRKQPAFADTLGYLYLKKGDLASANQVFAGLAKSNPTNVSVQLHYGEVLLQKGEKDAARAALTAALSNKPDAKDEARIRQLLASR